jgi:predicted AlkP superfamily phosphohydrolase/phosphomutase
MRRIWIGAPPRLRLPVGPRRFFAVPNNDVYGGIRVNLVGREPCGLVHPGKEYDALFEELRSGLRQLVNVDTGQPVVRDVFRLADVYRGECFDALPDFCVEWNRDAPISGVASPAIGTLRKRFRGVRNGDHKPEGFFWAMGPGIEPGLRIEPVSVMDFGATISTLLGAPLPDVDGKPIDFLVRGRERFAEPSVRPRAPEPPGRLQPGAGLGMGARTKNDLT